MRRLGYIVAVLLAIAGGDLRAQFAPQEWTADQAGMGNACYDVSSFSANNLASSLTQYTSALPSGEIVIGPQPVANWPVASVRWYCVDGSRPDDSGAGYSDTSSADCGTKAKKTLAGLGAIFPRVCASRKPVVVIADGTYTDGLDIFLEGVSGCAQNYPIIVATGTNATANATAFLGDSADRTFVGGVTATGMNAAGYTPVGTPTTGQIQFTKFGGGAPGLPAEPASPLGYRVRFDCATATTALRCFSQMIIGVPTSDTVNLLTVNTTPLPAAPSTSDKFYIEQPGVIVGGTNVSNAALTLPGPGSIAANALTPQIVGIYINTSSRFSQGRYGFMFSGHAFFATLDANLIRTLITYKDETGTSRQVGSSLRADGISGSSGNIGIGSVSADETIIVAGPISFTNEMVFKLSNGAYAHGVSLFNCNPNIDDPGNQPQSEIGGRQPNAQPAVRIVGATAAGLRTAGLNLVDSSITVSRTAITSVGANPAIVLQGRSAIAVSDQLSGSSGNTDVGLDLVSAKASTVLIYSIPTVTGTAGDVRLADGTIATWAQAAAGLIDTAGNMLYGTSSFPVRVMPSGTFMSGGPVTVANMSGGGTQCVQVNNAGTLSPTGASCGSGSGTVMSVTGAGGLVCSPASPNPTCTLDSFTCSAGDFVSSSTTGGLACTTPVYPVMSVTGTALRISATPTTGAVVVDTIGGFYSGATSSGNQDLGALTSGELLLSVSGGVASMSTVTPYQCLVGGSDATPDYLANKISAVAPIYTTTVTAPPPTSGLKQWLDGGNVALSGSNITTMTDLSGNGNHATGGVSPTINASSINGQPGATFASGNYLTNSANLVPANNARQVIVVMKYNAVAANYNNVITFRTSNDGLAFCGGGGVGPFWYNDATSGARNEATTFSPANNTPYVIEWGYSGTPGTNLTSTVNGVAYTVTNGGSGVPSETGSAGFFLGGRRADGFNLGLSADIDEEFVYDHILSGSDENALRAYIQTKYAIALGATASQTVQVSSQGLYASGSTSTTAQNLGSLTTGLLKGTVAAAVNTISTAAAGTDYQAPLAACTDYVHVACQGATSDIDSSGSDSAVPVIALHDGSAGRHPTTGAWGASQLLQTDAGGNVAAGGIPNDTVAAGDIKFTAITAPATPAAGFGRVYVDSTSKNIAEKNDAGTVNHGSQTFTCSAHQFATAEADTGVTTCNQPTYSDISGTPTLYYQTVESNGTPQTQRPQLDFSTNFSLTDTGTGGGRTIVSMANAAHDLSGQWPNISTIGITESSGPTDLPIGAIPDSNPDPSLLMRVSGGSSVVGIAPRFIGLSKFAISYGVTMTNAAIVAGGGGWLPIGTATAMATGHVESVVPQAITGCRIIANVSANSVTGGVLTASISENGGPTSAGGTATFAAGATGQFDSGFATIAASGFDAYGVTFSSSAALATGSVAAVITVFLY